MKIVVNENGVYGFVNDIAEVIFQDRDLIIKKWRKAYKDEMRDYYGVILNDEYLFAFRKHNDQIFLGNRSTAIPNAYVKSVADYMNKVGEFTTRFARDWQRNWDDNTILSDETVTELIEIGLDYDFTSRKLVPYKEDRYKDKLIYKIQNGVEVYYRRKNKKSPTAAIITLTDNKKIAEISGKYERSNLKVKNVRLSRSEGKREKARQSVIEFINNKGRELKLDGSTFSNDQWFDIGIEKNKDGTLSVVDTAGAKASKRIIGRKHTFDTGYTLTKSRSGNYLNYTLSDPHGEKLVRVRFEPEINLPDRLHWFKIPFDKATVIKHISELISALEKET